MSDRKPPAWLEEELAKGECKKGRPKAKYVEQINRKHQSGKSLGKAIKEAEAEHKVLTSRNILSASAARTIKRGQKQALADQAGEAISINDEKSAFKAIAALKARERKNRRKDKRKRRNKK